MKHRNLLNSCARCCFEDDYQCGDEVADPLKAVIADTQPQMKCAGDEPHKQNKESQMFAAAQCETQKLDHVLPFCPTPISAAASERSIKASMESFDVQKETADMQLQMGSAGEDCDKQNKEFQTIVTT